MSYIPSMSEDLPNAIDRRRHARQRIDSLCPVWLGADNGGIVLNISEGGIAIQAIGKIADNSVLQMRLGLPSPGAAFEVEGQVAWTSESKKQAGVVFVGLAEQSQEGIREWISKQRCSQDLAAGSVRPTERENRVVSMPPSYDSGTRGGHLGRASAIAGLDIEAMFPSEKSPLPPRVMKVPVSPPVHAEQPASVSAISMKERLANIEQRAKGVKEKFSESASPVAPEISQPVIALPPDPEKIETALPIEEVAHAEHPPIIPTSAPSVLLSTPLTWAPNAAPPAVEADQKSGFLSAKGTGPIEAAAATPNPATLPRTAADDGTTLTETNGTVVGFSASREVAAEADPLTGSDEKDRIESALPLPRVRPPAAFLESADRVPEERGTEDIIVGLRAAIERSNVRKSVRRGETFAPHAHTERSDVSIAPGPVASVEAARSAISSPGATNDLLRGSAQVAAEGTALGEAQIDALVKEDSPKRDVSTSQQSVRAEAKSVSSRASWVPGDVRRGQALTAILIFALAAGTFYVRKSLKYTLGGQTSVTVTTHPTAQPVPQALDNLGRPRRLGRGGAGDSNSRRLERAPGRPTVSAAVRQEEPQFSSAGTNEAQTESAPLSLSAAPTIELAPPQKESAPSAIDSPSPKFVNSDANSAGPGGEKLSKDPSITSEVAVAPHIPTTKIVGVSPPDTTSPAAGAGDRIVPSSLLYSVQPLYPPDAAQKHIEGTVKLTAVIGKDGRVMGLGVLSGPTALVPAALSAAREWRYVPALLNGEPVETETDITIDFRLPAEANPR